MPQQDMSWFIAQPLFRFPDFSSSFSAFLILLYYSHLIAFHFLPGWPLANIWASAVCQALCRMLGSWRGESQTVTPECPFEWGMSSSLKLILSWIFSWLAFPIDFRLASPYGHVSQFLKIIQSLCVHTCTHTHIYPTGCFSGEPRLI